MVKLHILAVNRIMHSAVQESCRWLAGADIVSHIVTGMTIFICDIG